MCILVLAHACIHTCIYIYAYTFVLINELVFKHSDLLNYCSNCTLLLKFLFYLSNCAIVLYYFN